MFEELHELLEDKRISKNELLAILKENAQKISVFDLMEANQYILQDVEFVQDRYQDDFRQAYVKQFIGHINNIKNDNTDYDSRGKKERIDKMPISTYFRMWSLYRINIRMTSVKLMLSNSLDI